MHRDVDFDRPPVFIGSAWRAGGSGQTLPLKTAAIKHD